MPAIITIGEISRTLFKDNPSFEELKEKEAALSEEAKKSSEIGDEKAKDSHREVVALPPTLQEIVQEESKEEAIELYVKQAADHVIDLEKLDEVESLLLEEIKLWTNYCTRRVDEEFGESQYIKETIEQHIKQTLDRIVAALKSNHTKQEIAPSSTKRLLKGFEKSSQLRKYLISKVYPSGLPADSLNLSLLMKDISDYCFMLLKSKPEIQNKLLTIFPNSLTKEDLNCEEGVRTRLNEATKSLQNNDSQESLIRQAHERVIEKHAPRVLALETFPGHFRGDVHAIDALRYLLGEVDKTSHFGKAYYFNIPHKDASEIYFQYSADMNEAIIAIEKERHYKRALEKKDEIIKYLMTHPMYKKDGTQIYYDEQENSYRKEGNKIYRLDGNEELFFVQEDDKKRCYYLGTDSNKVYLPISNPGEITPFIPLFETFLKALGLQLPNPNKLVDDEYMNWLPELKLQSGKFEEAFKECDFTPSITVQNPLFVEAVTDLKLMPTEDDFTRSTEVVSSVTFPDSLTSKHAAQSFGYLVRADSLGNRQAASRILHILTRALSLLKVEEELSLTKRNSYHIFSFSGMQFIDFIFSITSDQEYLTSETNILGIFQQSIETLKK